MFTGHYGPSGALAGGRIKLWHGAVAVQFLDLLGAPLILVGVEKVRITPNFTASNHFDLYHMPITHSLPGALFWSVFAAVAYWILRRSAGVLGAAIIGALVFSHWGLDYITHKPDLPLWFGGPKVGLGLWDYRPVSFGLELALFVGGLGIFLTRTKPKPGGGLSAMAAVAMMLIVGVSFQVIGNWGPPPESADAAAQAALLSYAIFIALSAWLDGTRRPAPQKLR